MERLQKVLAQAGIASRRKSEELITSGRVSVDGKPCTTLGTRVDPKTSHIEVDGVEITRQALVCVILHKPTSYVSTTSDPEGRRTVMDLVEEIPVRVHPIGRLDYDTTGVLLFTNDGELTNRLLHPRHESKKTYRVTVIGMPEKEALEKLKRGVNLEDGVTAPATVNVLRNHPAESVIELVIHEGRNRQVRRMFEALELPVKRLKRTEFAGIQLDKLHVGEWRMVTKQEWDKLYHSVDLPVPPYPSELAMTHRTNRKEAPVRGNHKGRNRNRPSTK